MTILKASLRFTCSVIFQTLKAIFLGFCIVGFFASLFSELTLAGRLEFSALIFLAVTCLSMVKRAIRLAMLGLGAVLIIAGVYINFNSLSPESSKYVFRLPNRSSVISLVNSIVREEDGIRFVMTLLYPIGGISQREYTGLDEDMTVEYNGIEDRYGILPTPLTATYLGGQRATSFDLVSLPSKEESRKALVFLHGFGGNFSLLCFIMAEAVSSLGLDTFCPSVGPLGIWSGPEGEATISSTIQFLKENNYQDIYLAGLSNGAITGAPIAKNFKKDVNGLIWLFGINYGASSAKLPTLFIYGKDDERLPASFLESMLNPSEWDPRLLTVKKIDGDHFALIKEKDSVQKVIRDWLRETTKGLK